MNMYVKHLIRVACDKNYSHVPIYNRMIVLNIEDLQSIHGFPCPKTA